MNKVVAMARIFAKSAGILLCVILWIVGLSMYKQGDDWFSWGGCCCIGIAPQILSFLVIMFKGGYNEGRHHWAGNFVGNSFYLSDKRWVYALVFLGIGVLLALLAGPIVLPIITVLNVVKLVGMIKDYRYLV